MPSDPSNGMASIRHQAITQTNVDLSYIGPLGTNLGEILIKIKQFSLKKMHLKTLSAKMFTSSFRLQCVHTYHWPQHGHNELCPQVPKAIISQWPITSHHRISLVITTGFQWHTAFLVFTLRTEQNGWHFENNISKIDFLIDIFWIVNEI